MSEIDEITKKICCIFFCHVIALITLAIPVSAQETGSPQLQLTPPELSAPKSNEAGQVSPEALEPQSRQPFQSTEDPAAQIPVAPLVGAEEADAVEQSSLADAELTQDVQLDRDSLPIATNAARKALDFLYAGGPSIWAIAALSVITLALILWKIWQLALIGAWSRGKAGKAVSAFESGNTASALALVQGRHGVRSKVLAAALNSVRDLPEDCAREETSRVAKNELASARAGLGALELISTIAPLLGLLGTVLGMIAAFQALQSSGSKADPALLAGGIWEALLTTAAGMAVAIPASAALTWFEAVIDRIRRDIEDNVTRVFVTQTPVQQKLAAE